MKNGNFEISIFYKYYEKHKQGVYNFALKILRDRDNTSEVTQRVFVKLFENLKAIRDEKKISAWIFKTARNEIYMLLRRENKMVRDFEVYLAERGDTERSDPEEQAEKNDLRSLLLSELDNLSEPNREIFVLREYCGLSYKEIGQVLDLDVGKVKSRLFNVRKKLIEKISKII